MKFLSCALPPVRIKADWTYQNEPVAVSVVQGLRRSRVNHYFDEEGYPAIEFVGTGAKWVFADLAQREAALLLLMRGSEQLTSEDVTSEATKWSKLNLVAPACSSSSKMRDYRASPVPLTSRPTW